MEASSLLTQEIDVDPTVTFSDTNQRYNWFHANRYKAIRALFIFSLLY